MKMKKFVLLLTIVLTMNAINCTVSAEEYLNTSSMGSSEIMRNINEENTLIEKRTEALLLEDKNAYNYYNDEIKKQGMKEISIQEILELTGEKNQSSPVANAGSRSDVRFECKKYSYKYSDGKTYSIMRIVATPKREGLLYKTGISTVKNSSSAAANTMSILSIGASSIAGYLNKEIGIAQTVYSALSSSVSALKTTSVVTSIKSSYTWNSAETCTFIYIYDKSVGSYKLAARYHKASVGVAIAVPKLVVKNKGALAVVNSKSFSCSGVPENYGSVKKAVSYFKKKAVYTSSISKITIKGIEKKVVASIRLNNPQTPSEAGY